MGVYYEFYTEVFSNGKWVCVNGMYKDLKDGEYKLAPTLTGQSYLTELYEKISYHSQRVNKDSLSDFVKKIIRYGEEDTEDIYYDYTQVSYLSLNKLRQILPDINDHTHHGFVDRNMLYAFKNAEADDIYEYFSAEEYDDLSDEAKKAYVYHEWDCYYDWLPNMRDLIQHVEWQLRCFMDVNYLLDEVDVRIVAVKS